MTRCIKFLLLLALFSFASLLTACGTLTAGEKQDVAAQSSASVLHGGIVGYRSWALTEVPKLRDKAKTACASKTTKADYDACTKAITEPTFGNIKKADNAIRVYAASLRAYVDGTSKDYVNALNDLITAINRCGNFFNGGK